MRTDEACSEGMSVEFLDHPADIKMHCTSNTLQGLYEAAVRGMMGYAVEIHATDEMRGRVEVRGSNEMKLVQLLAHFIDLMYGEGLVVTETRIDVQDDLLVCEYVATEGSRCKGLCEIKAITFCGLRVFEIDGVFHLHCVFDV